MNLQDYEKNIKNLIIKEYGSFLNKQKLSLLNTKNYTFTTKEELIKGILNDLIETTIQKQIANTVIITYGTELKNVFINYIMYKLNKRYNLQYIFNDKYYLTFQYFDLLNQNYPTFIEENIFTKNASELEEDLILAYISKYYNRSDLFLYNTKINYLKNKEDNFEQVNIEEYLNQRITYYQNLINKYSKGEKLTQEEMNELQGTISSNTGYTLKSFAIYVIILTLFIASIFLALILM